MGNIDEVTGRGFRREMVGLRPNESGAAGRNVSKLQLSACGHLSLSENRHTPSPRSRVEQRFTRRENSMMNAKAGLVEIRFGERGPCCGSCAGEVE